MKIDQKQKRNPILASIPLKRRFREIVSRQVKPGKILISRTPTSFPFLPAPGSPAADQAGSGSGEQITDGDKIPTLSTGTALCGDLPKVGKHRLT